MRFPERAGAIAGPGPVRRCAAALIAALAALSMAAGTGAAQEGRSRIWLSGWAGGIVDIRGFSEEATNAFYRFDDTIGFGAGIHRAMGGGPIIGIDVAFSRPSYERFDRNTAMPHSSGDARVAAGLASVRLQGGGGILGVYLSAGAGVVAWDLDDPELENGWDIDPALQLGGGVEYRAHARLRLFAEYGYWWIYHQKDETVVRNTATHNLVRAGARVGF